MTRRGSLAYYLAAWICGCSFISLAVWLKDLFGPALDFFSMRSAFGLLFFCFYGLLLGAFASFLGAFLLRRVVGLAHWQSGWSWAAAGAVLAPVLIGALGAVSRNAEMSQRTLPRLVWLATYGPGVVLQAGWWLSIPAGAATAFVLFRIHRAFAPDAPEKL